MIPAVGSLRVKGSCCCWISVSPPWVHCQLSSKTPNAAAAMPQPHSCLQRFVEETSSPTSHSWGGLSRWICAWRSSVCALWAREDVLGLYLCRTDCHKLRCLTHTHLLSLSLLESGVNQGYFFSAQVLTRVELHCQKLPSILEIKLLSQAHMVVAGPRSQGCRSEVPASSSVVTWGPSQLLET